MQILASALPGFRDLRAPLTAGYLWLVFLWIVIKPDLTIRPAGQIAGAVYDLGKAVGPIWIGLGVSVAAYLVGSVSRFLSDLIRVGFLLLTERDSKPYRFRYTDSAEVARLAESAHPIDKLTREASLKLFPVGLHPDRDEALIGNIERDITYRAVAAREGLRAELQMPATLLLGQEAQLFTEADRLKAESDLRYAVVVPLLAISLYLAISETGWWALTLLPVAILAAQGHGREQEFQSLMESLVIRDIVRSDSIEALRLWVSMLPLDGQPPKAAPLES